MARKLDLVTPDIGAPDAARPDGYYLDEDAGVPGTPILADEKTSMYYYHSRAMRETGRTFNGNPDNIDNSQFFDSLMELISGRDPDVDAWSAGTYNANQTVIHKGLQWFVGQASTINTPGQNSQWALSKTLREYMNEAANIGPMMGGFLPIDDIRDTTNYRVYYKEADLEWFGDKLEAWTLHIDGSGHVSGTSDVAKLIAASKFGTMVTASDAGGTITLKDYLGTTDRAVDVSGGDTEDVGDRQEDAFQGHWHKPDGSSRIIIRASAGSGGVGEDKDVARGSSGASASAIIDLRNAPSNNGQDGDPRTASETRMKNFTKGVPKLTVIIPAGTI